MKIVTLVELFRLAGRSADGDRKKSLKITEAVNRQSKNRLLEKRSLIPQPIRIVQPLHLGQQQSLHLGELIGVLGIVREVDLLAVGWLPVSADDVSVCVLR